MTDVVDMAAEIESEHVARGVAHATAPIAAGYAGECDDCGHYMLRLVLGRCGFCRDGRLPPENWEPPQRPANLPTRTPTMPVRSISLPASEGLAFAAVEERAKMLDCTLGVAAADLILAGAQTVTAEASDVEHAATPTDVGSLPLNALLDELHRRFDGVAETSARVAALETELKSVREAVAIAIR